MQQCVPFVKLLRWVETMTLLARTMLWGQTPELEQNMAPFVTSSDALVPSSFLYYLHVTWMTRHGISASGVNFRGTWAL